MPTRSQSFAYLPLSCANGFYAFLVMIPLLLLLQKKRRGRLLLLTVCAVAGCLLINGAEQRVNITTVGNSPSQTIPISRITRDTFFLRR